MKCRNEFNEDNLIGYKVTKSKVNDSDIIEIEVEQALMSCERWILGSFLGGLHTWFSQPIRCNLV